MGREGENQGRVAGRANVQTKGEGVRESRGLLGREIGGEKKESGGTENQTLSKILNDFFWKKARKLADEKIQGPHYPFAN